MISPEAAVLFCPAAKFRIRGEQDTIAERVTGEIFVECRDRAGEFRQERLMAPLLLRVRIETSERDEKDPSAEVGRDQLGDRFELGCERAVWVLGCCLVAGCE